ncbi:DegV family protein [Lactobacillus selangorensis]|uniref:DegV family protein n=1 Tax=Lactobacillus selangorensis TaxID=81857 RepID=UPI0007092B4E|nr:DegV family protein [Lactobacillus selangorensis]
MSKIKIVTDSSVQLTPEEVKQYEIHVLPLTVMIDNTVYIDDVTITRSEFMDKMAAAKALPKTSQPAIGEFVKLFNELGADGSQVLSINMMSAISGTVNTAEQAGTMSDSDVTVYHSGRTDRAMSFQVLEAAKMAQAGQPLDEIVTRLNQIQANTRQYMAITDLNNIVKGGRLSKAAGFITNLLNIKVILEVADNSLDIIRKGRGKKTVTKFVKELEEKLQKLPDIQSIGISYTDPMRDYVDQMKAEIQKFLPDVPFLVRETDPIIATYAGFGAFAITYYTNAPIPADEEMK